MWKTILTALRNLLTLARDLEENRREIKELNEKIYRLASAVHSLSEKIDSNTQREIAERKALLLQLENDRLKAATQTISPKPKKRPIKRPHARAKK